MKILYGTTNPAKLASMREALAGLDIELISLADIDGDIPEVREDGDTPLMNAEKKALCYYETFGMPVFSCDSGLYFYSLPEFSPGTHVRTVGGRRLSDDEMLEYYGSLAARHGDITAGYQNGICFIYDREHIYRDDSERLWGNKFIITSKPHEKRVKGFPLDSLSKRLDSGEYYYNSPETKASNVFKGFREFFLDVMEEMKNG